MSSSNKFVKKSNQHHVWQQYLRAWQSNGKVHCLQNGRVFDTGTPVLGMDRDFYKVNALTDEDLALLKLLAFQNKKHTTLRETHEDFLRYVLTPTLIARNNPGILKNQELQDVIDTYNTNVVDTQHTILENSFGSLLTQSLNEDIRWYENGFNRISFFTFISAQNLRTRSVKNKTIAVLREKMGLDVSRIWNILAVILAFNSGVSLFAEPEVRPLVLVRNNTSMNFITGDQPVVNLASVENAAPEHLV
jgi:hypothetical protein